MALVNAKYGPFHRLRTPRTQSADLARIQQGEGRICGRSPNWGGPPSVKAYRGPLPIGDDGIEFWTDTPPTAGTGTPTTAYWREGSPGVSSQGGGMVCIDAIVTRRVP